MEIKVECEKRNCPNEVDSPVCDSCIEEYKNEAVEIAKAEAYKQGYADAKDEYETVS